jgi:hypothetical protein
VASMMIAKVIAVVPRVETLINILGNNFLFFIANILRLGRGSLGKA